MKHDPLKEQLMNDIKAFREEKVPRSPDKKSSWVRKVLYLLIGISTLAGLIRIVITLVS